MKPFSAVTCFFGMLLVVDCVLLSSASVEVKDMGGVSEMSLRVAWHEVSEGRTQGHADISLERSGKSPAMLASPPPLDLVQTNQVLIWVHNTGSTLFSTGTTPVSFLPIQVPTLRRVDQALQGVPPFPQTLLSCVPPRLRPSALGSSCLSCPFPSVTSLLLGFPRPASMSPLS